MKCSFLGRMLFVALLVSATIVPAYGQTDLSQVRAGKYDNGRMWTFDYPPLDEMREFYGFAPDEAWFEKARLGALRLPNCTASFVSPNGLVMTNHHCGRNAVAQVTQPGETLLDDGFMAKSLEEERQVPGLYVDQLVAIEDVTDEIYAAVDAAQTDAEKVSARQQAIQAAQARILTAAGGQEAGFVVQVISLYSGGRYSAYTFKRYGDLRVVMAPELQLGFFGGDTDNFTYPRYALDMTFFRVYDNGVPIQPKHYFKWSEAGSSEGEPVFVIGNPGSTNRLETISQLEWRRDVQEKALLAVLDSRIASLREVYAESPSDNLINMIFGLSNSQKLYRGRVKGLNDPIIMAKRADTEDAFVNDLQAKYGDRLTADVPGPYLSLIDDLARIQEQKRVYAAEFGAFQQMAGPGALSGATERRAVIAHDYLKQFAAVGADGAANLRRALENAPDQDARIDERFLANRLQDFVTYFGANDPAVQQILAGRTPQQAARETMAASALATSEKTKAALAAGTLTADDPAIRLVAPFMERRQAFISAISGLQAQEAELNARHGRARFDIYGTTRPPDATFSLRIADGRVSSYEYNGTKAPAFTTFHGLFNAHYSMSSSGDTSGEWALPERWLNAPPTFDRSTPMNLATTNDIIGGNSGSPLLNKDLEVVGLIFDGNIESLPSAFIYQTEGARAVAVDSRGMLEALDEIYDMDRMVLELKTGKLVATEAEADAQMR